MPFTFGQRQTPPTSLSKFFQAIIGLPGVISLGCLFGLTCVLPSYGPDYGLTLGFGLVRLVLWAGVIGGAGASLGGVLLLGIYLIWRYCEDERRSH